MRSPVGDCVLRMGPQRPQRRLRRLISTKTRAGVSARHDGLEVRTMKQVGTVRGGNGEMARAQLSVAVERHQALEARLKELGRHAYLTPLEQREVSEIKKHKLRAKDEITALRREL